MDRLDYIVKKYQLDINSKSPVKLNISRHGGFIELLNELDIRIGAEIGVEQGKYSEEILNGTAMHLFCIDPWMAYFRYKDHRAQSKLDGFYEDAKKRLEPFDRATIIRKTSMEAVADFQENSLDFVYIDGNHDFEYVVSDIIHWSKIVKPGGIVAGHDYRAEEKDQRIPFHVIQAVNAYSDAYHIRPVFLTRKDRCASWFWVKP